MWIESMNCFEIQCITERVQIDVDFCPGARVSLDSVEGINWNEEKETPKEKINTEIVFTDLKSPP